MTRHQESIDEMIDRVAAGLTMVPGDAPFVDRIAEHLEIPSVRSWPLLVVATATIAAVVALAVIARNNHSRDVTPTDSAHVVPPTPAPVVARRVEISPSQPPAPPAAGANISPAPRRVPRAAADPLPEIPQIDPLTSPALLAVDVLPTDALTIAAVDLAPLDLADLAIAEIENRDSPKE